MDDVSMTAGDTAASASTHVSAEQPRDEVVSLPNPIRTDPQAPDPKPTEQPVSAREALEKAAAKVEKDDPDSRDAAKSVHSDAPQLQKAGRLAAKDEYQRGEAPARFSADAKAAWATAPESVRAETHRAIRELEQGYEKHRAAATAYDEIREFDELAKQSGTTMRQAMSNYVGIEMLLRQDPIAGLEQVANNFGFSLRDVAAHVMGETPDQRQSQNDTTARALRTEIAELRRQVGDVSSTIEEQRTAEVARVIEAFADQPEHSRFDELADDIEFLITSGRATTLDEAYQLADRLNPASRLASSPALTPPADLKAHTDRGSKSVTGAPGPGSDPVAGKPSSSIRDALRRAAAAAG